MHLYVVVIPTDGVGQGKLFESGSCITLREVPNYLVPIQRHMNIPISSKSGFL